MKFIILSLISALLIGCCNNKIPLNYEIEGINYIIEEVCYTETYINYDCITSKIDSSFFGIFFDVKIRPAKHTKYTNDVTKSFSNGPIEYIDSIRMYLVKDGVIVSDVTNNLYLPKREIIKGNRIIDSSKHIIKCLDDFRDIYNSMHDMELAWLTEGRTFDLFFNSNKNMFKDGSELELMVYTNEGRIIRKKIKVCYLCSSP
ncbi:MAG: hypothetical protein K1X55_01920 [Chitinophagales bacterium]|nr:hypothetical protein [Chitinophagales bacterium]